jgi:arginase family enzyme
LSTFLDPNWERASSWLAGTTRGETVGEIAVLGAPVNASITPGRCDLAPAAVRSAMHRLSCSDLGRDVRSLLCRDLGDLPLAGVPLDQAFEVVRDSVAREALASRPVVVLGGDNALTRAGVHGLGAPLDRTGLVTLDAHLDMRDTASGLHNGNPVRALLEDGLPGGNVVQIGIAPFANSSEYFNDAKDAGVFVVTLEEARARGIAACVTDALDRLDYRTDAIYFDLDVDVLDRAFAPACPGSRPGGLAPHEAMGAARLAGSHPKVRAMDLVEVDPQRDVNDATCLVAGQCLLAFACGLVARLER